MPTSKKRVKKTKKINKPLHCSTMPDREFDALRLEYLLTDEKRTNAQKKWAFEQLEMPPVIREAIGEIDANDDWYPLIKITSQPTWSEELCLYIDRLSSLERNKTGLPNKDPYAKYEYKFAAVGRPIAEKKRTEKEKAFLKWAARSAKLPAANWVHLMKSLEREHDIALAKMRVLRPNPNDKKKVEAFALMCACGLLANCLLKVVLRENRPSVWEEYDLFADFMLEIDADTGNFLPRPKEMDLLQKALSDSCQDVFIPLVREKQAAQLTKVIKEQSPKAINIAGKKVVLV